MEEGAIDQSRGCGQQQRKNGTTRDVQGGYADARFWTASTTSLVIGILFIRSSADVSVHNPDIANRFVLESSFATAPGPFFKDFHFIDRENPDYLLVTPHAITPLSL
jgi:hypothetical protein